jgi:PAS domain S-box-containing protein
MDPGKRAPGVALVCDLEGNVLEVTRDDLGFAESDVQGRPFALLVDRASLGKALSLLVELQAQGAVFGWELNVPIGGQVTTLHFAGAASDDRLLIIGARTNDTVERLSEDLVEIGSEQMSALRAAVEERAELVLSQAERDSVLYDELTRLNNELANLQRQLAKQNVELERLNEQARQYAAGLEERVAERTAELRASEARFRTLFEQAAVGIALVNMEGEVVESNPAFQTMLGFTGEELCGRAFGELFLDPGGGTLGIDLPIESIDGGQDCCRAEGRYVGEAGQPAWAYVTASLVRGEDGEPQFGIYMVEDITERKRAQAALIQAEKLAIAGKLSASLAHEINNPLQSVIGCLGLAQETLAEGNDATEFLEVGLEELRRVARIVAQLRDMYRPSRPEERQLTEVNVLLKQVLTLSRKRCEEQGVDVVWRVVTDLPYLFVVPDQVQQVFLNLVLNAVDAMPEGGRLQIQTAGTQRPGGVRISFTDSGVGIPADVLSHVFDPFYSTKPSGLGLGLFISKDIVEQHSGRIEVEDAGGEGTMFTVWLPAESRR